MKQGQFRFSNDTYLNVHIKGDEIKHIAHHEEVHRALVSSSTFGVLLLMIEKASIVDDSKLWLFNEFIDISGRMNEQVATFVEYLWIYKEYGKDQFDSKVKELKYENKRYFNHFNSIYKYIKDEDLNSDKIDQYILLVKNIGILSLNINLLEMEIQNWVDKKDLQRFYSNENNVNIYNPNKRFEILVKFLFQRNEEHNERAMKVFESTNREENIFETCKSVIGKLYKNSNSKDVILERISKFTHSVVLDISPELFTMFNAYPSFEESNIEWRHEYSSYDEILKLLRNDSSALLHFNHALAGLENLTVLSYMPTKNTIDFTCRYKGSDLISVINSVNNPVVFSQGKLYKRNKTNLIDKLVDRKIYIYMENALASSYKFIVNEFSESKFIIVPEKNYDIVAICNLNHILIQVVIKGLISDIRTDFDKYNIVPANFVETTNYDLGEIRKISNALFIRHNWALNNKSFGFAKTKSYINKV